MGDTREVKSMEANVVQSVHQHVYRHPRRVGGGSRHSLKKVADSRVSVALTGYWTTFEFAGPSEQGRGIHFCDFGWLESVFDQNRSVLR
uniref:PLAT domain-containing protein n=1 Tax=Panagrellus redivivus TaxID=6233 RepID=A0A7E4V335_PANRE